MAKIPDGWELWTVDDDREAAWSTAVRLKQERERLRPDLFVRVRVVWSGQGSSHLVLRREEKRA